MEPHPRCSKGLHEWGYGLGELKGIELCKVCGVFKNPVFAREMLRKPVAHLHT